jgi:hypothetical protein
VHAHPASWDRIDRLLAPHRHFRATRMHTPWFPAKKHDPLRAGTYEICERPGADTARCRWDGRRWCVDTALHARMGPNYWRGLTDPPLQGTVDEPRRRPQRSLAPAGDGVADRASKPSVADSYLTVACPCGGQNESCFRRGGWGYIDPIGKGRAAPPDFVAESDPRRGGRHRGVRKSAIKVGSNKANPARASSISRRPLFACARCGAEVRDLQKHWSKAHSASPLNARSPGGRKSGLPSDQSKRKAKHRDGNTIATHENRAVERKLDATRDYYAAYRENGRFGSHSAHDDYGDEAES